MVSEAEQQRRKFKYFKRKNMKKGANRRGLVRKNGKWVAWWREK